MDNNPNGGMNNGYSGGQQPSAPPPVPPTPPPSYPAYTPPPSSPMYSAPPVPPENRPTMPVGPTTGQAMVANYWFKTHWKIVLLVALAVITLAEIVFQIVYPSSRLTPGTTVDGVPLGWMRQEEATKKLNGLYGELKLDIYFGKNEAAFEEPKMKEVGIGVDNSARLAAIEYPFFLRFVPTSIFWAHNLAEPGEIEYVYDRAKIASYTTSKVGEDCSIPAQNATLKLVDSKLQLVPSIVGGRCNLTELQDTLAGVKPDSGGENSVRISIVESAAPVTDEVARALAAKLNSRMAVPMPIKVDKKTDKIPGRVVLSWLDFEADVPERRLDSVASEFARLLYKVNEKRMEDYINQEIAPDLIIQPGVSKVSTLDFKETSRKNGTKGRVVDMPKAVKSVEDYINSSTDQAVAATKVVGPSTVYTRKYTPTSTGFAALFAQFDQDHVGKYSVSFEELNGVRNLRKATHRGTARMPAAGIHALYIAYTNLIEQRAGRTRPVDVIADGIKASECFEKMLREFHYKCRVGFYNHFGFDTLTQRAKDLGLKNTVFAGESTVTSTNDLNKLLAGLYKTKIARKEGGQKILTQLRNSRNREGIPEGLGDKEKSAANIIGEEGGVINDAAIVYSTGKGAYAISIMTVGGKWEDIAELVEKIQDLKMKEIPKEDK